jgi:recombination protein RecA
MNQELSRFKDRMAKSFGDQFIYYAGEAPPLEVVSTGSVQLDFATGSGGIPRGRVVEIYGPESIGKTALSYYMIAEEQKKGRGCLFINLEGNFDPKWAETIAGVDISRDSDAPLMIINPANGKEAVEICGAAVASGGFGKVVFDSIGAMLGEKESKPGEEKQAGGQSALVTHLVKLVTIPADRTKTTCVFLNQIRDAFSHVAYQKPPGGHAVKHMAAIRIHLKPTPEKFEQIVHGEKIQIGFRASAKIVKNKAAAPNNVAFWNFYNRPVHGVVGIDRMQEIIDLSFNYGVIPHTGGGYYQHELFPLDEKTGIYRLRGKEAVLNYLQENPEVQDKIRMELMDLSYKTVDENEKVEL